MTAMNTDGTMSEQVQFQNWNNFCRYHARGDWHGTWTRYNSEGKVIESFRCVRSLHANVDGSEINHQNHYTYADGKTETKTFGPYQKPTTRALFLDNSFSWGSTKVGSNSPFGFETGFRYENKGASAAVIYDNSGRLQRLTIISEHLTSFAESPTRPPVNELSGNWQGTLKTITPELTLSSSVATAWNRLEDLGKDYLTLHHPDGVSVSCPQQLASRKEFVLAVDWQVNDALLQRGSRHFDTPGFTRFTLEVFTLAS